MSLIETLAALGLLALVLSLVFGFFDQLSMLDELTEAKQKQSFHLRYAESRLSSLFQNVTNDRAVQDEKRFFFYLSEPISGVSEYPSLVFTFDNGVRRDPALSGVILARLYVASNSLRLALWPLFAQDPHAHLQEEVLLEGVQQMGFSFFMPPHLGSVTTRQITTGEEKQPPLDWSMGWDRVYKQLPAILKINLVLTDASESLVKKGEAKNREKDFVFSFVLPSSKNHIYYPPE